MNIPDKIDINKLGENITLDSAEDKKGGEHEHIEPDYSKMFQACSVVSEIKDENVIFTNGTSIPLSQIPLPVNDTHNIGVPVHDPPFDKPSYIDVNDRLDTYKKIFLTVMPTILRRESYPFNFDKIIDLSNEITVKTMRQFAKMKNYYSEHI